MVPKIPLPPVFTLLFDVATGVAGSEDGERVALEIGLAIGLCTGDELEDERLGDGVRARELCAGDTEVLRDRKASSSAISKAANELATMCFVLSNCCQKKLFLARNIPP